MTMQDVVLTELGRVGQAGSSVSLIAGDVGLAESQVRNALSRLHARGLVFCFGRDGRWGQWEITLAGRQRLAAAADGDE